MSQPLPPHRLLAWAQSWPYASDAAFRRACIRLNRKDDLLLVDKTDSLATAPDGLEEWLRPRAAGLSLDSLRQIRDAAWFPRGRGPGEQAPPSSLALHLHLGRVAETYLEPAGNRCRLRAETEAGGGVAGGGSSGPPGDKRLPIEQRAARWRWLSLACPPDLLVAALFARGDGPPTCDDVTLVTPHLDRLLRKPHEPLCETHLHVGAGLGFAMLWTNLVRHAATSELTPRSLRECPQFGPPEAFLAWLLTGLLARATLAWYLRERAMGSAGTLDALLGDPLRRIWRGLVPQEGVSEWQKHREALGDLERPPAWPGAPSLPVAVLRDVYRRFTGLGDRRPPTTVTDIPDLDPVTWMLPAEPSLSPLPETTFLYHALRYLAASATACDETFARLFWQYVRVRNLTYRYLTQEPGTGGLDWFVRHYERIGGLRGRALEEMLVEAASKVEERDAALGSIEVRTRPESHWDKVRDHLRGVAEQALRVLGQAGGQDAPGDAAGGGGRSYGAAAPSICGGPPREFGVVYHFVKRRTFRAAGEDHAYASPEHYAFPYRYGPLAAEYLQQAEAVATALDYNPELLIILRGCDVATIELAVPTWVLVRPFGIIAEAAQRASHELAREYALDVPPTRLTAHAGEDFRRLSEGLRRVHEFVEFCGFRMGDRIGHGVALGTDPSRWAESCPVTSQPAEERLDDLLWEIRLYQRQQVPVDSSRVEFVKAQIRELGKWIYGSPAPNVEDLLQARQMRFERYLWEVRGYPSQVGVWSRDGEPGRLLYQYLTDMRTFQQGQEPWDVVCDDGELRFLQEAQRWLWRELGRLEATVESNPSSNLLIGDMPDLRAHPVFRMSPLPHWTDVGGRAVMVSVNDDDPITFATRVVDEFAHIFFALLRRDVPARDALAWLEQARDAAWRGRFTLPMSADARVLRWVAGPSRAGP